MKTTQSNDRIAPRPLWDAACAFVLISVPLALGWINGTLIDGVML
ncbi:MAG: hypothetical protein ACRCVX_12320 [Shewanella sp.]